MTANNRRGAIIDSAAWKPPCLVVATSNLTLSGLQTIDSVTVEDYDRVLVTGQSDAEDNGIWLASSGNWTRATDFDGSRDVVQGTLVFVTSGTNYANSIWYVTTSDDITVGTTELAFAALTLTAMNDLAVLEGLASTGFPARTASNAWSLRTLEVTDGLSVTNPAGVAGNPSISLAALMTACGRITLTSNTPVLSSTVSAATTVYYTPYLGHTFVPIKNASGVVVPVDIGGQLSQSTTDNTKSPAAVANSSNYDLFVWEDGSTPRCTRGPAWSSSSSRGTGAGTTELDRDTTCGTYHNKYDITNGPAAGRGTYVGSVRSNGSAQIDMNFGGDAAGGTAALFGIWNMYNRVAGVAKVGDTTANWSYTSNTLRPSNNSTAMRISFLSGLPEDGTSFSFQTEFCLTNVLAAYASIGLGFDSTTVSGSYSSFSMGGNTTTGQCVTLNPTETFAPQTGWHFVQALERSDGTNATTFTGGVAIPDYGYSRLQGQIRW